MAMFSLCSFIGNCASNLHSAESLLILVFTGIAPMAMSWVEARPDLEWRWIQWIQIIFFGASLPFICMIAETREGVILRRKAARMRKDMRKQGGKAATNESVDHEYRARSEVNQASLGEKIKISLTRPFCEFSRH
jgi:hypothetical protein